jgi:small subunit ribosomal protein S8
MSFDQIADMLTRIRNAQKANKRDVSMPASKLKLAIAQLLYKNKYIDEVSLYEEGSKKMLRLGLRYVDSRPVIKEIRRVSRQGQRIYTGKSELPVVKNGYGIAVISTSKGVMTNLEAKAEGIGGEIICEVW